MAVASKWALAPTVAEIASRRVHRGSGVKGFANARSVRQLFEQSYTRALKRLDIEKKEAKRRARAEAAASTASPSDAPSAAPSEEPTEVEAPSDPVLPKREPSQFAAESLVIIPTDVIGPPPDVRKVPDLAAALRELDHQIGLESVKMEVCTQCTTCLSAFCTCAAIGDATPARPTIACSG
jgi:hypothetical protein